MLVSDLADQFLDDVLKRDRARRAAVFVDHDRHLHPKTAKHDEERAQPHGLGDRRGVVHQGPRGNLGAAFARHRDSAADVHKAKDVVARFADHRKA